MTKGQLEVKQNILAYLQQEVRPEKAYIVDDRYHSDLLEIAEKHPLKALQQWQKDSHDYNFSPFKEQLNDREIHVQEYMKQKLFDEGHRFSEKKYADITANLLDFIKMSINSSLSANSMRKWHGKTPKRITSIIGSRNFLINI